LRLRADRTRAASKGPLKLLGSVSVPKLDLREFDLGTVKSVADRVAYGQQASDIAAAVEKTRNNN
jgi:hypothetical protein